MRSVVRIYLSPPFFLCPRTQGFRLDRHGLRRLERRPLRRNYGDVAQFGRAPPLHGGGCRFEPGHLHQLLGSPGAATRKPSGVRNCSGACLGGIIGNRFLPPGRPVLALSGLCVRSGVGVAVARVSWQRADNTRVQRLGFFAACAL